MESLYTSHQRVLNNLKSEFRRDFIDKIDWQERMIAIKGARGVGKTTLMLQHLKEKFNKGNQALYISMDNLQLTGMSIWEIATYHQNNGGTHLFIDEIHKYANWSIELKNIYDTYPNLSVVFSSSSILQIYKGYADLSRRVVSYHLLGLSFREYIQIESKQTLQAYELKDILENHQVIASEILEKVKPLAYWKSYLQYGYFPFYLQGKNSYFSKLNTVLSVILEVDLPYILEMSISNVGKLKRLLKIIASSVPFQPNVSKLGESLSLTRNTLTQYLYYLEQAELLNLLTAHDKSYTHLTKPEKIYLQNPNLAYALNPEDTNIGTLREMFFYNQVNAVASVNAAKNGDFLVNEKYVFEIGGLSKDFSQIAKVKNSYLALDDMEIGHQAKIPLWLFGFLY